MSKITLNDVTNIGSLSVINDNFDKIEQELQSKVLYRDNPVGEPNVMENSIDMNGFDILNAGQVFSAEGRWATIDELEEIKTEVEAARDSATVARDEAIVAADSASASNVEVQSIYDNFDDRYLGQKTSDPSVDNDGGMLLTGALYFRTSGTPTMRVYNGTTWQDVGSITTTTTNLIDPTLYSSQAEAEAGANNTKVITPLRAKNAIDAQIKGGFTSTGDINLPGNTSNALGAVPKQQAESIASSAASASVADRVRYSLSDLKTSTSGSSVDFLSIPSWAKRITISLSGVSTNGSSALAVRVGDGAFVSSGYAGSAGYTGASSAAGLMGSSFTTETASGAGVTRHGHCLLTKMPNNTWVFSSVNGRSDSFYMHVAGGSISLSGTLDRVQVIPANFTDQFDSGSISIMVEG